MAHRYALKFSHHIHVLMSPRRTKQVSADTDAQLVTLSTIMCLASIARDTATVIVGSVSPLTGKPELKSGHDSFDHNNLVYIAGYEQSLGPRTGGS